MPRTDILGDHPPPLDHYSPYGLCVVACLSALLIDHLDRTLPDEPTDDEERDYDRWIDQLEDCLAQLRRIDPDEHTPSYWSGLETALEGGFASAHQRYDLEGIADAAWSCAWLYVDGWP